MDNADPSKTTFRAIEINNYNALALLVEGVVIDSEGVIVDDSNAPARMLWIPGVQGTTNMVANLIWLRITPSRSPTSCFGSTPPKTM